MKRRLAVLVLLTVGLVGHAAGAHASIEINTSNWGCAGSQTLDLAVCVSNPLPERLPIPESPDLASIPR